MQPLVPVMTPAPGERLRRFVGDRVGFVLKDRDGQGAASGWRALLRTNLGRAALLRREIVQAHTRGLPLAGASWRDIPMREQGAGWGLEVPLAEAGYFKAKAYLVDPHGWQHWPAGPDIGIAVHPDRYRTGNSLYCAFTRLFGATRTVGGTHKGGQKEMLATLDEAGYAVIPPSGKLRDVIELLPHIMGALGCRILQLLPVSPTPTVYARFGRFGSPYAALDLRAIDAALVVFDRRTTGVDQFRELTYATHYRGGRVFLDLAINHTGWGSVLQENHPEWFLRQADGRFASPGAWGTTWEDLVELKHENTALWDELAETFLVWCERGVDGFRCDAGYKVPVGAWQYIVARVQEEYPETMFLLEGLGGAWETTEALLTEGGLQWAYSELFQNYSGPQVAGYLDHSFHQSERVGLLVHYSETHDNERLAARGRAWSLLRNRLCALAGVSGGFGITCGVEWLAAEKIEVHESTGLAWGNGDNLVPELATLNGLLAEHPCFFDGARLTGLSAADSAVYVLRRESAEGKDVVLVVVNTDVEQPHTVTLSEGWVSGLPAVPGGERGCPAAAPGPGLKNEHQTGERIPALSRWVDLLGQRVPELKRDASGGLVLALAAGGAYCLAPWAVPRGRQGDEYRRARAQSAWALNALNQVLSAENLGDLDWQALAAVADRSPEKFLAAVSYLAGAEVRPGETGRRLMGLLLETPSAPVEAGIPAGENVFPNVVTWELVDRRRITVIPPGHWLLIRDAVSFRATLGGQDPDSPGRHQVESISVHDGHIACFAPRLAAAEADLILERYAETDRHVQAAIRFLPPLPGPSDFALRTSPFGLRTSDLPFRPTDLVLLTNGRGGMARLCLELGRVNSKYDCVLGANLHPTLPVDRHIFVKRVRVWVNADGFISTLSFSSLVAFEPGPPAVWHFVAPAGDGRTVEIRLAAEMLEGRNTTVFRFTRPTVAQATGKPLPPQADVRLTVRFDLEDRNFHWETKRNAGAEHHFSAHIHALPGPVAAPASESAAAANEPRAGFAFTPAPDRQLRVFSDAGSYHPQPEWSENIPYPVEQSRGQVASGDAFSPGWFELPLPGGAEVTLVVTADAINPDNGELDSSRVRGGAPPATGSFAAGDVFGGQLLRAARSFIVRRGQGKTVIAGYPWFLDWGRDTFICARGLLAAGLTDEVRELVVTFARFEKDGTLPNTIHGEDASNRDTSDAPLWFGLVCEELAALAGSAFYETKAGEGGRTVAEVLWDIALNYAKGTPNGIRMDAASGLIWSPRHFTWMDTNHPACTPREGYPVEIQALWIRLLRQLERLGRRPEGGGGDTLAARALASLEKFFWREERGYYADLLAAQPGQAAAEGVVDEALRSNCLFVISLGLASGERARRCVAAAGRYLVVPGALRSLAPLPVTVPLPNYGPDGRLLNNPVEPYWGRYEGDEDTRRKPAYHNGTAWTWTFPSYCEALARAWDFSPGAVAAARACLGSVERLMAEGCLGQVPEILDGDAPHTQRGCDAQAWGGTEALRVWKLLRRFRITHSSG